MIRWFTNGDGDEETVIPDKQLSQWWTDNPDELALEVTIKEYIEANDNRAVVFELLEYVDGDHIYYNLNFNGK